MIFSFLLLHLLLVEFSLSLSLSEWPLRIISGEKTFSLSSPRAVSPSSFASANPGSLKITPLSCLAHARSTPNPRASSGQEYRLRLKRPTPNAARRCPPFKSSTAFRALAPTASFRGSLCFASLSAKKYGTHIFQLESELQNIPEAAPKASPSFSVSEKLARYGSSALSGVEHLTLLVGKESVALALIRHFGSLKALARASFQELRQFLPRHKAEAVVAALSMSAIAETEHARSEQLDNPESIYRACADMKLFNQEVLRVILLDTRYRHISTVEITKESINESLAHPRDIFRPVIGQSAYAFVLVHNLWVATHRLCYVKCGFMCGLPEKALE